MKYLRNGQAVEVVCELPNAGGFVVQKFYDNEDGGQYLDDKRSVVDKVYNAPPVEHIDKRIREAEHRLQEAQAKLNAVHTELRTVEQERKAILTKLQQVPALRRLEDWIDGKVTHFVVADWTEVKVLTKEELICQADADDRYKRPPHRLKLVTLFGEAKGDLNWQANQYKDGSGSSEQECFMCCSEHEAITKAAEIIDAKLKQVDEGKTHWLQYLIKSADAIGHAIPDRYREIVKQQRVDELQKKAAKAKAELAKVEEQILLVKQNQPCPQLEAF